MKPYKAKARIPLCGFILLAFFLPAYQHYSAFEFIPIVLRSVNKAYDITTTDAVIAIVSLLLVPFSAILLILRTALRVPTRRIYVSMPLIFFLFFAGILFTSVSSGASRMNAFAPAGYGFYIAALASVLLLLTENPKTKRHRRRRVKKVELAA